MPLYSVFCKVRLHTRHPVFGQQPFLPVEKGQAEPRLRTLLWRGETEGGVEI